ncbi:MAG: hypothetical protein RR319_01340 [Bacteroides sp.]
MAYSSKTNILAKGTGEISIADPVTGATLISAAVWDPIMVSLKGTCVISQEEGEKSETYIDQADAPVDMDKKTGKMTIAWTLPNTCKSMWDLLCTTVDSAVMTKVYTPAAGEEVIGVKLNAKNVIKMLKIKMKKGGQTFIFPNLDWSSLFSKENEEDPASFKITTTVMAALDSKNPDFIIVNQMTGSAV